MIRMLLFWAALPVAAATQPVAVSTTGSVGVQLTERGALKEVYVTKVLAGSPADQAGLAGGDWIVSAAGKDLRKAKAQQVASAIMGAPGSTVRVEVVRGYLERLSFILERRAGLRGEYITKKASQPDICARLGEAAAGRDLRHPGAAECGVDSCWFDAFAGESAEALWERWVDASDLISACPEVEKLPGFTYVKGLEASAWRFKSRPELNVLFVCRAPARLELRVSKAIPPEIGSVKLAAAPSAVPAAPVKTPAVPAPAPVVPPAAPPAAPAADPCAGEDEACYVYMAGEAVGSPAGRAALERQSLDECNRGLAASCRHAGTVESLADRPDEALRLWTRGCELGDSLCCFEAGNSLFSRRDDPRAHMRSAKFFLKACNARNGHACSYMGLLHRYGPYEKPAWFTREDRRDPWMILVLRNEERARNYFQRACDLPPRHEAACKWAAELSKGK